MTRDKGRWTATEQGLAALTSHADPEAFMHAAERLSNERAKGQEKQVTPNGGDTADEGTSLTIEEAVENALAEIEMLSAGSSGSASAEAHPLWTEVVRKLVEL